MRALLALFAATGWLMGLVSLEVWKEWLERRWGRARVWAFVAVSYILFELLMTRLRCRRDA